MDVCTNILGTCPLALNLSGTVEDGGITRNTYSSSPPDFDVNCGGSFIESIVIWDDVQDRWEIRWDADGAPLTYSLDMFYSTVATEPNPPDENLGNWQLDTDGAGFACNTTGFTLNGSGTQSTLPVTLLSFAAEVFSNKIMLKWKTSSEINNDGFSIERSEERKNL